MAKLLYKLEISGKISVKTGLHIGGSDVDFTIGGIDNEVAKNKSDKRPYIPGSSLSGKLRHLIAKSEGYEYLDSKSVRCNSELEKCNWDHGFSALLFAGKPFFAVVEEKNDDGRISYKDISTNIFNGNELSSNTRLLIRDDFELNPEKLVENILEDKAENTINRNTGEAKPRHIERVTRGTEFGLSMILDIYEYDDVTGLLETLNKGFNLLNYDYLGGMGSRGSGSVKISIDKIDKLLFSGGNITRSEFNDYRFQID